MSGEVGRGPRVFPASSVVVVLSARNCGPTRTFKRNQRAGEGAIAAERRKTGKLRDCYWPTLFQGWRPLVHIADRRPLGFATGTTATQDGVLSRGRWANLGTSARLLGKGWKMTRAPACFRQSPARRDFYFALMKHDACMTFVIELGLEGPFKR